MHMSKDFAFIIEEFILILRQRKYIFTTKGKGSTNINQGITLAWLA